MNYYDYHVHTNISPDSEADIVEVCKNAIERGMTQLCITDHLECGATTHYWQDSIRPFDQKKSVAEFLRAKEFCKDRLKLALGVEVGQWQQDEKRVKDVMDGYNYDFILFSMHSPTNFPDACEVDYSLDINDFLHAYFEEILSSVNKYDFDSLGHLTLPIRYADRIGVNLDLSEYYGICEDIFKVLAERGKSLEVNTSGFRNSLQDGLPGLELVKMYKRCGGEFLTVGSDSHRPQDIGVGIREGQQILRDAGFKHFAIYNQRQREMISL